MSRKTRKSGAESKEPLPSGEDAAVEPDADTAEARSTVEPGSADDAEPDADTGSDATVEGQSETAEDAEQPGDDSAQAQAAPAATALPPERLKSVLESLLFVSDRIVTAAQLARAVHSRVAEVRPLIAELMEEYSGRGIELSEVGGGYQFRSAAQNADFVREFVAHRPVRLTRAQLETLALVAYRQPITRPEIDEVRGVDTGSAVKVLLERNLIKLIGRKDEPGRPLLYGTTPYFLEFFGMKSLGDLPTLKEFTELTDENRELFQRKTGEDFEAAQEELQRLAEAEQERLALAAEQELNEELSDGAPGADDDTDDDDEEPRNGQPASGPDPDAPEDPEEPPGEPSHDSDDDDDDTDDDDTDDDDSDDDDTDDDDSD